MAAKKRTTNQIVEQDFPGWKVIKEHAAGTASDMGIAADTASPPLDEIKAKYFGVEAVSATAADESRSTKKKAAKKAPVKHAKFVTIAPESQPDALAHQQKVILIRDGKVVAQQG